MKFKRENPLGHLLLSQSGTASIYFLIFIDFIKFYLKIRKESLQNEKQNKQNKLI